MSQILRYAELVEEASYAPVTPYSAGNPKSVYIDPRSIAMDTPNESDAIVPSAFGRAPNRKFAGFYAPSGDFGFSGNVRNLAHCLKWVLGGYAFTGGTGGTAERQTLTVTAADADGGQYSFQLPNVNGVMLTYTFTAAASQTATQIAAQIAGGTFSGWTATAAAGVVTFVRTFSAANTTLGTFAPGTSGTTGTFARTVVGVAGTMNVHESWGSDTRILPSVQGRFGKDNFEHLFSGMIFDTLSIEVEDELAVVTVEANASKDAKASLQTPSAVLAALPVEVEIPFTQVTVTFNGVVQARKVKTLTFSVSNNSDPEMGRYLGSRYAGRIPSNERETTIEAEVDFSDTAEIERIWGGPTGPTDTGSATFPVELTFAGSTGQSTVIKLPKFFWTTVETQPEEREEITQALEGRALSSSILLNDGVTSIVSDVYTKTLNSAPIVEPAA